MVVQGTTAAGAARRLLRKLFVPRGFLEAGVQQLLGARSVCAQQRGCSSPLVRCWRLLQAVPAAGFGQCKTCSLPGLKAETGTAGSAPRGNLVFPSNSPSLLPGAFLGREMQL